ncbi:DUF2304 domain-containing protein [Microbacterium sp. Leaf203]|jgi:hypothetical protein|uniref:DUF2304 domain-containing protein n=1 Tax=Microbacterium sp. Leaf203 TaxID=1735677 RepID=UPI0006F77EFC|nr:DUF2304 domain-containing protein [Microbacterium sp. Leaf203]KQM40138.1 hypothetical protein ASE56_07180 [Microbacterium sp. Leaf203]
MIVPVGIAFALIILALIVTMLMRRHLREKYAVMWLLIGAAMLVLALFPDLLGALAGLLGVIVPSNLLFALAVALLIGVTLHLSWELSRAEEEIRRVAEEVAILRAEVERLQASIDEASASPSGEAEDRDGPPVS